MNLRSARWRANLTLRDVAKATGIDVAHLSRVERSEAHLSVPSLAKVCRAVGLHDEAMFLEDYREHIQRSDGPVLYTNMSAAFGALQPWNED